MKKTWWFAIAAVLALASGLAILIPSLETPAQGISYANYSLIEKGMTRDEIVELLGSPNLQDEVDGCAWQSDDGDIVESNSIIRAAPLVRGNDLGRTHAVAKRDRVPLLAKPPPPPRMEIAE